ncbi:MAG: TraR/DksA family transcriptional regulator [bacterium]|nr:TraR/DksA family transcriptional regulator [bacterium]
MKEIKEMLIEMQQTIIDEIEQDRRYSDNAITNDIGDDIDHASEERDRELYQLLGERDRRKLEQIASALERIEDSTYGVCEDCGAKISKKRLMALPFTELCIDCKNEEERTRGKSDLAIDSGTTKFMDADDDL